MLSIRSSSGPETLLRRAQANLTLVVGQHAMRPSLDLPWQPLQRFNLCPTSVQKAASIFGRIGFGNGLREIFGQGVRLVYRLRQL